ncbi:MAG TPA: 2-phosphosulfolactate phosphatase [Anaerolineaceae bacterium]|nr:2-phosphosulfolactate phosphatase [Anaerolineaceae bacterium]HPN50183.1 2-phosphosulfolactate phosphatase [Anaerolineaceae bacterium]
MQIKKYTLSDCHEARGLIVVIDVLRAFSTAACAFARGAKEIWPVSTVEEALALRENHPGAYVMGEVGGVPPEGFDFGNSPLALADLDLSGRTMIQRTGAGTQGLVLSQGGERVLAASFACAASTAEIIRRSAPEQVSFVVTGVFPDRDGDEDEACADYIAALISDPAASAEPYLQRVVDSSAGQLFSGEETEAHSPADLAWCCVANRYPLIMEARRESGRLKVQAKWL